MNHRSEPHADGRIAIKNSSVAKRYGISSTPKIFVIDSESRIVAKDLYGDILKERITEMFSGS